MLDKGNEIIIRNIQRVHLRTIMRGSVYFLEVVSSVSLSKASA